MVKPRVWYTVYIQIANDVIETWFEEALPEKNKRIRLPLFAKELDRPSTKGVGVGISVAKGTVFIDEFKFYPGKVPEPIIFCDGCNPDPIDPVDPPEPVPGPGPVNPTCPSGSCLPP